MWAGGAGLGSIRSPPCHWAAIPSHVPPTPPSLPPAAPECGRMLRRLLHQPHMRDEPEQPLGHQLPRVRPACFCGCAWDCAAWFIIAAGHAALLCGMHAALRCWLAGSQYASQVRHPWHSLPSPPTHSAPPLPLPTLTAWCTLLTRPPSPSSRRRSSRRQPSEGCLVL